MNASIGEIVSASISTCKAQIALWDDSMDPLVVGCRNAIPGWEPVERLLYPGSRRLRESRIAVLLKKCRQLRNVENTRIKIVDSLDIRLF